MRMVQVNADAEVEIGRIWPEIFFMATGNGPPSSFGDTDLKEAEARTRWVEETLKILREYVPLATYEE